MADATTAENGAPGATELPLDLTPDEPARHKIVIRLTFRDATYQPIADSLEQELRRIPGVEHVEVAIELEPAE